MKLKTFIKINSEITGDKRSVFWNGEESSHHIWESDIQDILKASAKNFWKTDPVWKGIFMVKFKKVEKELLCPLFKAHTKSTIRKLRSISKWIKFLNGKQNKAVADQMYLYSSNYWRFNL